MRNLKVGYYVVHCETGVGIQWWSTEERAEIARQCYLNPDRYRVQAADAHQDGAPKGLVSDR